MRVFIVDIVCLNSFLSNNTNTKLTPWTNKTDRKQQSNHVERLADNHKIWVIIEYLFLFLFIRKSPLLDLQITTCLCLIPSKGILLQARFYSWFYSCVIVTGLVWQMANHFAELRWWLTDKTNIKVGYSIIIKNIVICQSLAAHEIFPHPLASVNDWSRHLCGSKTELEKIP